MPRTRPGGGPLGREYGSVLPDWRPGPRPAWGPPQSGKKVVFEWPPTPFGHQISIPPNPLGLYPGRVPAEGESNFYYHDQPVPLRWVDPLVAGGPYISEEYPRVNAAQEMPVLRRALWGTPRFDLKPFLRGSASFQPDSYAIWRGSVLQVQCFINRAAIRDLINNMRVYAMSYTSAFDPNRLSPIDKPQDITQEFFNGNQDTVFTFPTPSGVRYWQVQLVFDIFEIPDAPPIRLVSVLN